jgi:hypothetical protein
MATETEEAEADPTQEAVLEVTPGIEKERDQ